MNAKRGNFACVAHDLLGFFNKDPFNGGCQVLTHLDDPADVLWTNCDERIEALSPDGKRVATIALLSDGIGPADVMVRKIGGAAVAHYSINGWFGRIWWETPTKLLMESNGNTQSATVRCKVELCNRATDLDAHARPVSRLAGGPGRPEGGPDHRPLHRQPPVGDRLEARAARAPRVVGHLQVAGKHHDQQHGTRVAATRRVRGCSRPAAHSSSATPLA